MTRLTTVGWGFLAGLLLGAGIIELTLRHPSAPPAPPAAIVAAEVAARDTLRRADTALVANTKRVRSALEQLRPKVDTLWRHDTVRVAGDSTARIAIPLRTLARTDTALRACSDLERSCMAYRVAAQRTIAADSAELAWWHSRPPPASVWRGRAEGAGLALLLLSVLRAAAH